MANDLKNSIDLWETENPYRIGSKCADGNCLLKVDVEGFEGPLDLLLELSRKQKVDLARISILTLARQYLKFIGQARKLRVKLAADYLVMAACLAFLKSKLLLPVADGEEGDSEEMSAQLTFRLRRLEAMREAGRKLFNRGCLGRDFFARGIPETMVMDRRKQYGATLYDLLVAYGSLRQRQSVSTVTISRRQTFSLQEARERLVKLMGERREWTSLDAFLQDCAFPAERRASAKASSFAVSLELAREGVLALRQEKAFLPLFVKRIVDKSNLERNNQGDDLGCDAIAAA